MQISHDLDNARATTKVAQPSQSEAGRSLLVVSTHVIRLLIAIALNCFTVCPVQTSLSPRL